MAAWPSHGLAFTVGTVSAAHVASLLVLDHVAVRDQLAKYLAIPNVLEQGVDLLGEKAVDYVWPLARILVAENGSLDVAVALIVCDLALVIRQHASVAARLLVLQTAQQQTG